MYNAYFRAVVRCSALYDGNARKASGQAVLVYGMVPKAILGVMGYVFFSPQEEGHGAAVYDSSDLKAATKRIV